MALSGGNAGFPIGDRRMPLSADRVFNLSLEFLGALGLFGITDGSGVARPVLAIPNEPSLVGTVFFAAAVTLDLTRPFGIDNISNELAIRFVQ
jgi:hypothetical protein